MREDSNMTCPYTQQPIAVMECYPYQKNMTPHQCDCCTHMHQPETARFPVSGPMQENAFMLINNVPYITDNTNVSYGTKLSVSESIYTRFTKRKDPSCVNIAATIDMTGDIITNTAWNAFVQQVISSQYETLNDVLQIQKSSITFKIYFHVEDSTGGVVYESSVTTTIPKYQFHYTDVQDYFVTSFKDVVITNIPALDFQGVYNLIMDKIEAYIDTIDTYEHITDSLNPYYQFINNNTHIVMQHNSIEEVEKDDTILIATADLDYTTPFQANLTTRVKISFTAFMSNMISCGNTYPIYKALYNPTEEIVSKLLLQIQDLSTRLEALETEVGAIYSTAMEYKKNTYYHEGVLTWITKGELYQTTEAYTTTNDESITIEEAFAADIANGKLVIISTTKQP